MKTLIVIAALFLAGCASGPSHRSYQACIQSGAQGCIYGSAEDSSPSGSYLVPPMQNMQQRMRGFEDYQRRQRAYSQYGPGFADGVYGWR